MELNSIILFATESEMVCSWSDGSASKTFPLDISYLFESTLHLSPPILYHWLWGGLRSRRSLLNFTLSTFTKVSTYLIILLYMTKANYLRHHAGGATHSSYLLPHSSSHGWLVVNLFQIIFAWLLEYLKSMLVGCYIISNHSYLVVTKFQIFFAWLLYYLKSWLDGCDNI